MAGTPTTSKNSPLAKKASTSCASPPEARSRRVSEQAAAPATSCGARARISSQIGFVHEPSLTRTSAPGSRTGSARRIRLSTSVKIAVFAPIPSASEATATNVNPGLRRSTRSP
jgi:hypothetical protein